MNAEVTWNGVYAGDVEFSIGDWRITIFNDCCELDYCDSAIAPDGRQGDFDYWWDEKQEPISLLTIEERAALERLLEEAK